MIDCNCNLFQVWFLPLFFWAVQLSVFENGILDIYYPFPLDKILEPKGPFLIWILVINGRQKKKKKNPQTYKMQGGQGQQHQVEELIMKHRRKYQNKPGHDEKLSDHSRTFSNIFLDQFRPRNPDESTICMVSHCSSQQCLPCTRWSIQQNTLFEAHGER